MENYIKSFFKLYTTAAILGVILILFGLIFPFNKITEEYKNSLELKYNKQINDNKIEILKNENHELKNEITDINKNVGALSIQINQLLNDYRQSKSEIDTMMEHAKGNVEILDTLIKLYNIEVLGKASLIDSINNVYEEKATLLFEKINLLNDKNYDLELNLFEQNKLTKLKGLNTGILIYYLLIMLICIFTGVFSTKWGIKNIIKTSKQTDFT
ncbi:MAG: hypothetical protein KAT68_12220 [Bacteroidales bacterium]|nr:hypothetical protein [Bacteroidales bacterium]